MPGARKVLFVCVENAGRSQIAEGFFRRYAPEGYEPVSAGTRPVPGINPLAVQAMREVGIDIGSQKPKMLTGEMIGDLVLSVNMGCMDKAECPAAFMKNSIDWNIEDPRGKPMEKAREIRDEIESRVRDLCKTLE